jgi:hypothetical protein
VEFLLEKLEDFKAYGLIKSQYLMLKNRSQLFIKVNNKSLLNFAIDKRKHKIVFINRAVLSNVFRRESLMQ